MTDLEKLVDLLKRTEYQFTVTHSLTVENVAYDLIRHGVTVQNLDCCEYCNGLPKSERDCFTMPNASKRDYDIVTIRFCPMCGRKFT